MAKAVTNKTVRKQRKAPPVTTGGNRGKPSANEDADELQRIAAQPAPSERIKDAITVATDRNNARRRRVQVRGEVVNNAMRLSPTHSDVDGYTNQVHNAFGTTTPAFAERTLFQLGCVFRKHGEVQTPTDLNAALAVVDGLQPENEIEAMLAAQMAATHDVAMHMLGKAKHAEYLEHMDSYGGLATKLLRTYTAQIEALAKLRRKGEQTVRVEHVHVHNGGQAIVGNVNHPGGGGASIENRSQPHATGDTRALVFAPSSPVWSENPERDAVPVAGGEWKGPL